MRPLLVRCTTSLAAALTLASFGIHFLYADNGREISQQAMKLNQRGLSHLHKKEYDQAIASFREALQIQAEYPDALDNLGKALDATGKDAQAIAEFDKALKIAPNNAAAYADRGMALFHEGNYEEAAASYRQAIEQHKDFSEAQNGLGASLLRLGKSDEAIAAFRSAVASNPKNADALGNLGATLLTANKPEEALPFLRKAHSLRPDSPDVLENYAAALDLAGQTHEAIAACPKTSNVCGWAMHRKRLKTSTRSLKRMSVRMGPANWLGFAIGTFGPLDVVSISEAKVA
jgi:tetratricopeptide (TPR) repeat protein